jgi:hypothetical protein
MGAEVLRGGVVLAEARTGPRDGQSGQLSVSSWRYGGRGERGWEHGEVVEGAGGGVDEHRSMEVELGDAALGPGGGWRQLVPTGPRRQRAVEQSGGGACSWMKVKSRRLSSARRCIEIESRPHGAVATDGVRSPPRHHMWCHVRMHG